MPNPTPKPTNRQKQLLKFVNNPENIKKAVEGSMEKRAKVIYGELNKDELDEIKNEFPPRDLGKPTDISKVREAINSMAKDEICINCGTKLGADDVCKCNTKDEITREALPPLKMIDIIDDWVHKQTRFHLCDTDGYKEMLSKLYLYTQSELDRDVVKARLEEVKGFAGTSRNVRKFCDHYEERYKSLTNKLNESK